MSPRTRRNVLVAAACTALAFAYWWPAFRVPEATGFGDWQMVHHNWEVGYVALTRHHELPLFDPYHCGGVTMVGNPESQLFAPLFLLALPLGTTLATKIFLALHGALALLGALLYARRVASLSAPASLLAALTFAGSGFFAWHGAGGHATFASFAFLPWLHLALREGERRPLAALLGGLLLALTVAEGGTYPFPYMLVSLGLAILVRLASEPGALVRVGRSFAAMLLVGLACAAHRLLPMLVTLGRVPRTIASSDASTLGDVLTMLTARDHEWGFPGHEFVWPEYGTYVGVATLALAAIGLLRGLGRRARPVAREHLILALAIVLLILGNASAHHPWPLLRALPVFDSLRVPSRFLVVLTFHLGVLAGLGLDAIDARRLEGRPRALASVVASLVVIAIGADLAIATRPIVDRWTNPAIDATSLARERTFVTDRRYDAIYASLPRRNESTTLCYVGGMNWQVSPALVEGVLPQARLEGAGRAEVVARSASTWTVRVSSPTPTRLVLNQNHDPDFRADVGRVRSSLGRLAVDLPAGERVVHVAYRPRAAYAGFVASALALLATLALAVRLRHRPSWRGASA